MRRVVITGMGTVNSVGCDCNTFCNALKNGISGIHSSRYYNALNNDIKVAAEIQEFSLNDYVRNIKPDEDFLNRLKPYMGKRSTLATNSIIAAAIEAYEMAGLLNENLARFSERTSVVVAGSNLNQILCHNIRERYFNSLEYVSPNYALQFFDTNFIGVLSELFLIYGEGFTVGGASASGNSALIQASRLIADGVADICLVAGTTNNLSPFELQGFRNLGALGGNKFADLPELSCRPFDYEHEGFILGQGSGCIILESEETALERGAKPLAAFLGGSMRLDGNHLSDARIDGEYTVMKNAIKTAQIEIDEIDYINTHGTSTPLGDEVEASAIKKLFGEWADKVWVNSTKGIIGHCLFSAGIIEAIASIIQMQEGFIHPNLNLERPILAGINYVGCKAVNDNILVTLSNSFGFGGINTSIILKKYK